MVGYMLRTVGHPATYFMAAFKARLSAAGNRPWRVEVPPEVVCHYTDMAGLRGILTNQVIWATDHHDVEDKDELRAAEAVVDAVVLELRSSLPTQASDLLHEFHGRYSKTRIASVATIYLSCFTKERDASYHWDKFAPKGGACLVLKTVAGEEAPNFYRGVKLGRTGFPIAYDSLVWEARIREGLLGVIREYEAFARCALAWGINAEAREETILALINVAAIAGISSKVRDLEPEAEWRWAAVSHSRQEPPVERHGDKRYLPLRFRPGDKKFELDELIVRGPDAAGALREAREILDQAGYSVGAPHIRFSNHPFPR